MAKGTYWQGKEAGGRDAERLTMLSAIERSAILERYQNAVSHQLENEFYQGYVDGYNATQTERQNRN